MKLNKKLLIIAQFAIILAIGTALTVANSLCFKNATVITNFLCGNGLNDDSETAKKARQEGNLLAAGVMEDGAVLLKNENNVLPLKNKKVNVFGWGSTDKGFIPQGTGSGTGARNDYVTFLGGLKAVGIEYNEDLANDYASLNMRRVENESGNYTIEAGTDEAYKLNYGVIEAPDDFLNESRIQNAKNFSDNAVIVISRLLGEGNDYSKKQYIKYGDNDNSRKLQSISELEEKMIEKVCNNFDNVIVIINSTNPMEAGFLNNNRIDSAIYMCTPGTRGSIGIANLLIGEATPSGHLTDTWAYDLSTAASYATSGREGVNRYSDSGKVNLAYSDYIEDIYVGYKWYETADQEGFWNSSKAKQQWGVNNYNDVVQYPFGYGLSYTSFEWKITDLSVSSGSTLKSDEYISLEVDVTNTGSYKGRDVVQLYYSAPYTKGGIEKSSINLLAFGKTIEIAPGETDTVYLEFSTEDLKSYDCYDRNNNGFMGYEVEEGKYTLSLRKDVHTLAALSTGNNEIIYEIPDGGYKYDKDSTTGQTVENIFTNYTNNTSKASSTIKETVAGKAHSIDGNDEETKIKYLTRNDFVSSFPYEKPNDRIMGKLKDDTMYVNVNPANNPEDEAPTTNSSKTSWSIEDMYGVEYDDPMWDEIVSQMSLTEQMNLIVCGGFGTIEVESIGLKATKASDGPSGFNNQVIGQNDLKAVNYPSGTVIAQTWDYDIAYSVGLAIGGEGAALGLQGWYGPGANIHRSPLGGRNFEYYSEDALLTGTMVAYEVMGAKEKGVTAYIKHIAVNDSDTGRNGAYKWLTEQSLREIYLKPFELAVKIGSSNGMMSSVDRIGSTRVSGSYALLTTVLRKEWGFNGTVITDYYQCTSSSLPMQYIHDVDECIRAGNSMLLHPDGKYNWFDDIDSNTAKKMIAKSVKDILFTYADTMFFSEIADSDVIFTKAPTVFPWWIPLLISIDVLVAGILAFWAFCIIKKNLLKKAPVEANEVSPSIEEVVEPIIISNENEEESKNIEEVKQVVKETTEEKLVTNEKTTSIKKNPSNRQISKLKKEIKELKENEKNTEELLKTIDDLKSKMEEMNKLMQNNIEKQESKKINQNKSASKKKKGPSTRQQISELKKEINELKSKVDNNE